jgi:hypothetical protein
MKKTALFMVFASHWLSAAPLAITGKLQLGAFIRQQVQVSGPGFFLTSISSAPGGARQVCVGDDLDQCFLEDTILLPVDGFDSSSLLQFLGTTVEQSREFPMFDTGRIEGSLKYTTEPFVLIPDEPYSLQLIVTGFIKGFRTGESTPFVHLNILGTGAATYYTRENDFIADFSAIATPVPEPSTLMIGIGAFSLLLIRKRARASHTSR